MTFWILVAVAAALGAIVLVRPLLRRTEPAPESGARGLAIYRDQLAEIDGDRAAGLISEVEAEAARTEIERRILKAAEAPPETGEAEPGTRLFLAGLVLGAVPAASLALYLAIGTPAMPGMADVDSFQSAGIDPSLPADILAESGRDLLEQGRAAEAAEAFAHAAMKVPDRADLRSQLGEARVAAANGMVSEPARAAFRQALSIDARDPRARFYLGLARAQDGDMKGAIDDWLALEADSPPGAPWRPMLAERLRSAAAEAGVALDQRRAEMPPAQPSPAPQSSLPQRGPTAADMAAAEKMEPGDRQQMIRGMVEGLAQRLEDNPADIEGWRRLARARRVLGEEAAATDALRRAAEAAPDRVDVLVDYARALHPPGHPPEGIKPEFVALMRRILALDGNNPEALFFVGEAEAKAGNVAEARALWGRLLARVDPKEPLHKMIDDRLKRLDQPR
jgi:cytochrome c-type biogenesis protein CcmH